MSGRIPQQFIDDLLSRADIVDVISSRVNLRKAGREFTACCPFHDEKTPSFTVSPQKQFYHCFGCGAHGNTLSFIMEWDNMSFVEAVEELAARLSLEVPRDMVEQSAPTHKHLYDLLQLACDYFRRQLRSHPKADQAVEYLKGRGMTGDIAAQFDLGYAPPGWDNLLQELGKTGEQQAQLLQAGLVIKKDEGGYYDRFRDRIMFPIRDQRGRIIGFGGRVMGDETPKYLNSPETPVFYKGQELYGLFQARKSVRNLERLLVVEGYMDVLALAQFDIRNVVATLGTATTPEHLQRLFRAVPEVVFCFDGDRAGRAAAWRAMENSLPILKEGRVVRFMFLPGGEDPDSLVRKEGREGFERRISQAATFSDFLYEGLMEKADIGTDVGKAQLVELARPYLSKIQASVLRYMMITRLADLLKMVPDKLETLLNGGTSRENPSSPKKKTKKRTWVDISLVGKAMLLLLHRPELASRAGEPQQFMEIQTRGMDLLIQLLDLLQEKPHLNCAAILEQHSDDENWRYLGKLAQITPDLPPELYESEFDGILTKLVEEQDQVRMDALTSKPFHELSEEEKIEIRQGPRLKK